MGAITDKIKGKLMKAEGRATDDKVRSAQGHAVEKKGKVKGAVDKAARKVTSKVNEVRGRGRASKGKAKRKASAARRTP